jgi:hypothetical protein
MFECKARTSSSNEKKEKMRSIDCMEGDDYGYCGQDDCPICVKVVPASWTCEKCGQQNASFIDKCWCPSLNDESEGQQQQVEIDGR